jgi:hypothetical protein
MILHKLEETQNADVPERISRLFQWAESIGIKINPKLSYPAVFTPGYVGTKTLDHLNPCEHLVTVPNHAMINHKRSEIPELQTVFNNHPEYFCIPNRENEDHRMLAYILYEKSKHQASYWYDYLSSLPTSPETVTEWNEKELIELQDSDFVSDALIRKNWNTNKCKNLCKVFEIYPKTFTPDVLEYKIVYWCWLIMTTRCFGGGLPYPSLMPVADLFNHSTGPTNYYYGNDIDSPPDELSCDEEDHDNKIIDESDLTILSWEKLCTINFKDSKNTPEAQTKSEEIMEKARALDLASQASTL